MEQSNKGLRSPPDSRLVYSHFQEGCKDINTFFLSLIKTTVLTPYKFFRSNRDIQPDG
jgi:hypothetical protein